MKICPKCRKENSNNSVHCEKCGARLDGQNSFNDYIRVPNRALNIVMCVLAFMLVIGGIILFIRNNPSNNVNGESSGANSTTDIGGDVNFTEEPSANPDTLMPPTDKIPHDARSIDGNYYKVYHLDEIDTWQKAQQYCIDQGGHLAVITSQELNDKLYELCHTQGFETAFFGFSDAGLEGKWLWVTQAQPAYRNWAPSEPDAGSSGEDFAMFQHIGKKWKMERFDVWI